VLPVRGGICRFNPAAVAALRDPLDAFWRRALEGCADVAGETAEEASSWPAAGMNGRLGSVG
jgi:hypothetical protein